MTNNPVSDLLVTITALMGGTLALATAVAKVIRWWNQGVVQRVEHVDDWAIRSFKENIAALKEENTRCWTEVDRLRREREESEGEMEELERRLQVRRDEVHRLNNLLASYVMRFGHIEAEPDENGHPT